MNIVSKKMALCEGVITHTESALFKKKIYGALFKFKWQADLLMPACPAWLTNESSDTLGMYVVGYQDIILQKGWETKFLRKRNMENELRTILDCRTACRWQVFLLPDTVNLLALGSSKHYRGKFSISVLLA